MEDIAPRQYGTLQLRVTPFGLADAPSTFQKLMQSVYVEELDEFVVAYLDDVRLSLVRGEEYPQHLRHVFRRMREQRLFVKLSKRDLATRRVQYPVSATEPKGVSADPDKLETVGNRPGILHYRKKLRGFLEMAGYYRRLIPTFNKAASPLYSHLRGGSNSTSTHGRGRPASFRSGQAHRAQDGRQQTRDWCAPGARRRARGLRDQVDEPERTILAGVRKRSAIVHALTNWKQLTGNRPSPWKRTTPRWVARSRRNRSPGG